MKTLRLGFIGLGCLGRPMVERLLSVGFAVTVFNRSAEKASELVRRGAVVAPHPAAVAEQAGVIITVVGNDEALESVCLGPKGIVHGLQSQATHVQMSTVSRAVTLRVADAVEARGGYFLDAPVLGSGPQAAAGNLIVMVGGRREVLETNRAVLEALGSKIVHTGEAGSASRLKLVLNQFIASMMLGFAQGMVLARKAGLSPEMVMEVLEDSALRSPFYTGKLERIRSRDFTPHFPTKWMLKDIHLILEAGAELGVPLPGMAAAREVFVSSVAQGWGDLDYSAVIETLERSSGTGTEPGRNPAP